ncbi:hypothetical protein BDP27DRAFT_1065003 [Rhodocollybia butyracea]|uniref:Uncharacterized protein n=1 Tax=Rhodocollybia butyracea TaxID=206335 RepID=A0A9P5U5N5_9AGAR|nr:hypothetical protein BDP27DRAFT_1065003 [Rhodocollybia butyracea]
MKSTHSSAPYTLSHAPDISLASCPFVSSPSHSSHPVSQTFKHEYLSFNANVSALFKPYRTVRDKPLNFESIPPVHAFLVVSTIFSTLERLQPVSKCCPCSLAQCLPRNWTGDFVCPFQHHCLQWDVSQLVHRSCLLLQRERRHLTVELRIYYMLLERYLSLSARCELLYRVQCQSISQIHLSSWLLALDLAPFLRPLSEKAFATHMTPKWMATCRVHTNRILYKLDSTSLRVSIIKRQQPVDTATAVCLILPPILPGMPNCSIIFNYTSRASVYTLLISRVDLVRHFECEETPVGEQ